MSTMYKGYKLIRKDEEKKNKVFIFREGNLIMRRMSFTAAMISIDKLVKKLTH